MPIHHAPPPGARVRVRGEEWAVEKSLPLPFEGGFAVHVRGLSELVRYHQAIFLTPLDEITELRPEETRLVADPSPGYRQTVLYLETLLRRLPPVHGKLTIGHRGALDVMPYQLVPAERALSALAPRLLLADGTGLGKTIELGILLSELVKRGRARRILVVAIRSMLAQLQRELWARFTLPLVRLDAEGLARVQAKIPANKNPFAHFDRCIVSMDTLKNQGLYRAYLEQIRWDVIVVDECHNVANRGSQRGELARLLSSQCDALILTSATPHNGRPESFANLLRMLDPTSIADPRHFAKADVEHLFVRRFKKDVEREAGQNLRDREVGTLECVAQPEDEAALAALHALELSTLGGKARVRRDPLVKWTLVKAYLSSPEACLESLEHRLGSTQRTLEQKDLSITPLLALRKDRDALVAAKALVERAIAARSPKLARLVAELRALGVSAREGATRVVIFSERIRTLAVLRQALLGELGLPESAVGVFTASQGGGELGAAGIGGRDEKAQRELVESFGHEKSPLRVLLCSDAASEGVNLHHQCHYLIHYDVPWSLIRLTQRNGRIDRFGQRHTPQLRYLVTQTREATADQHVVRRLIQKEREVERQLGDPGALLGLYDAEDEESFLTRGIAQGKAPEELLPEAPRAAQAAQTELASLDQDAEEPPVPAPVPVEEPEIDLLALLAEVARESAKTPDLDALVAPTPSLFADDYALLVATLRHLEKSPFIGREPLSWSVDEAQKVVSVRAPEPFVRHREPFLPDEAVPPAKEPYRLVLQRDVVADKLRAALEKEGRFPAHHLLWEQHPLFDWLLDALAAAYARGEAPLVQAPKLGADGALYLVEGRLHNHESEAVVARFLGVEARGDSLSPAVLDLEAVLSRTGLRDESAGGAAALANPHRPFARQAALQALVPAALDAAKKALLAERQAHVTSELAQRLRRESRRVEAWAERSLAAVDKQAAVWGRDGRRVPRHIEERLRREREHIAHVLRNHQQTLQSLSARGEPALRLVAVFTGERGES